VTPTQQQLEADLPHTPIIQSLTENLESITSMVEEDREFNKMEFERGTEKFKELGEGQREQAKGLREVKSEVSEMKEDYKKGVKEIVDTIHNKELSDLRVEIRDAKQKEKDNKMFWSGVGKTVLSAIVIAIVLFALSKIGLTAP
jgi:uncharacterized protein YpuA (DUF1002 family)